MWAIVYFVVHEVGSVIPTFGNKLLLFLRFIDHTVELWIGNSNETSLEDFAREINDLGLLERGFEEPSKKVSFLYLTISVENEMISTKTLQKAMMDEPLPISESCAQPPTWHD